MIAFQASRFAFVNPPATISIPDNNVNSIALTPKLTNSKRYLIFSPLTSLEFFSVNAVDVKNRAVGKNSIKKLAGMRLLNVKNLTLETFIYINRALILQY